MTTHSSVDDERREGFTVERFAEVMAYRKFFPAWHRDEVLLRLGIRPNRWARAAAAWGKALELAATTENPDLVLRFARAFGAMSRKLRERPPRLELLGEPLDPNKVDPDERPAPAPERPSLVHEQAPLRQTTSDNSGSVWTQYARGAVTVPAPPMREGALAPAPAMPPPQVSRRRALETTADISEFVPKNPSPFGKPGVGSGSNEGGS